MTATYVHLFIFKLYALTALLTYYKCNIHKNININKWDKKYRVSIILLKTSVCSLSTLFETTPWSARPLATAFVQPGGAQLTWGRLLIGNGMGHLYCYNSKTLRFLTLFLFFWPEPDEHLLGLEKWKPISVHLWIGAGEPGPKAQSTRQHFLWEIWPSVECFLSVCWWE